MNKIAIMQPYFFPYIGYFQLIHAADVYVNLDHVSFMKRSYMTRNKIKNDTTIKVQVSEGSQNSRCKDVMVNYDHDYLNKFHKTIQSRYQKSKNYEKVMSEVVLSSLKGDCVSISELNLRIIKSICKYLEINTKIIDTSENLCEKDAKREKSLKQMTKNLGGSVYINAIGGTKLYDKEDFQKEGINLYFVKTLEMDFKNPYYSTLHQLFEYSKDHVKEQLRKYELV